MIDLRREAPVQMTAPLFQRLTMNEPLARSPLALYELTSPTHCAAVVIEHSPQAARARATKADPAGRWQEATSRALGYGGSEARVVALEQ